MVIYAVIEPDMGIVPLIVALVAMGLVWGLAGGPASSRIVENVPHEDSGSASSLMSFFLYFGCALGTAMFAAFFGFGSGAEGAELSEIPLAGFLDGFHFAMAMGVALSLIALVLAAVVDEKKQRSVTSTS